MTTIFSWLQCVNFNPNMDCNFEGWEWTSSFIPHFIMDVVTYPMWAYIESMLVNGVTCKWIIMSFKIYPDPELAIDPI